jgi:hypothetical protein
LVLLALKSCSPALRVFSSPLGWSKQRAPDLFQQPVALHNVSVGLPLLPNSEPLHRVNVIEIVVSHLYLLVVYVDVD